MTKRSIQINDIKANTQGPNVKKGTGKESSIFCRYKYKEERHQGFKRKYIKCAQLKEEH